MHPYSILGEAVKKDIAKDPVPTAFVPGQVTTEVRCPALAPDLWWRR